MQCGIMQASIVVIVTHHLSSRVLALCEAPLSRRAKISLRVALFMAAGCHVMRERLEEWRAVSFVMAKMSGRNRRWLARELLARRATIKKWRWRRAMRRRATAKAQ